MGGRAMAHAVTIDGAWLITITIVLVPLFAWCVYDVIMLAKEARKERRWLEDKERQEKADKKNDKASK